MNNFGYVKYKVFRMKQPVINENIFSEKIRSGKQKKLIKKIVQSGIDVTKLKINWNFISENDNLEIKFIQYFKKYINFDLLSINSYLTINHIRNFKDDLNWSSLSKNYKFTLEQLIEFKDFVNWEYIFFYQNLTKTNITDKFKENMWWLFLKNKNEEVITEKYNDVNELIINKNIRTIPKKFVKKYTHKLNEYQINQEKLKRTLKNELIELIEEFEDSGEVKELLKINIDNGLKQIDTCDIEIQTEIEEVETREIEIQTEKNSIETCEIEIQTGEIEEINNPFEASEYVEEDDEDSPFENEMSEDEDEEINNPFETSGYVEEDDEDSPFENEMSEDEEIKNEEIKNEEIKEINDDFKNEEINDDFKNEEIIL